MLLILSLIHPMTIKYITSPVASSMITLANQSIDFIKIFAQNTISHIIHTSFVAAKSQLLSRVAIQLSNSYYNAMYVTASRFVCIFFFLQTNCNL